MSERETPMTNAVCERLALKPQNQYRDLKALGELAEKLEQMCEELAEAIGDPAAGMNDCSERTQTDAVAKYTAMKKELLG